MKKNYVVSVGNVGNVNCKNKKEAIETYYDYVAQSMTSYGRVSNEDVVLFINDIPVKEYFATNRKSEE